MKVEGHVILAEEVTDQWILIQARHLVD
jgi:hypothetical protein